MTTTDVKKIKYVLVIAAFFGILLFLISVRGILLPFVVGLLLGYLLDPAVSFLQSRAKLPRWLGSLLAISLFIACVAVVAASIVPVIAYQIEAFGSRINSLGQLWSKLYVDKLGWLRDSMPQNRQISTDIMDNVAKLVGWFTSMMARNVRAMISLAALLLITPIVSFYILSDWPRVSYFADSLIPIKYKKKVRHMIEIIDSSLSGFLRGQTAVCCILMIYYAVGLSAVKMDLAIPIGLLTGAMIFVPYIGWAVGFIMALGVAFVQFSQPLYIGIVAGLYIVGLGIEGWGLTPNLVGSRVGLHPVAVIFSLFAGGALAGILGVVLAVPVAAVSGAFLKIWIENKDNGR